MTPKIVNLPVRVRMIGHTRGVSPEILDIYEMNDGATRNRDFDSTFGPEGNGHFGLSVVEVAGRGCYEAYSRKNPNTDSHEGYVRSMLEQKHYSVLEHVSISFHISGISRSVSHELVRHRLFSFSQQSQRYCAVTAPYKVSLHPTLLENHTEDELLDKLLPNFELAEKTYKEFREKGLGKKQASEAAREFLPNAAQTHLVMTGNLRNWIEFVSKRDHPAADAAIRQVAQAIYTELKVVYPEAFSEEARGIWDYEFAQGENKHD